MHLCNMLIITPASSLLPCPQCPEGKAPFLISPLEIDFVRSGTSCERDQAVGIHLRVASCFWDSSMLLLYVWLVPFHRCVHSIVSLCQGPFGYFLVAELLGCFQFGAGMNKAAVNIGIQGFLWTDAPISLRLIPRSGIKGS